MDRLTDLFDLPTLKSIEKKVYDSRYVNVSQGGELVISKSELIIANILYEYEKKGEIIYTYKSKFKLNAGGSLKTDFTIEHLVTGRKFLWEHLGLLNSTDYRQKWEKKKQSYFENGVVSADKATIEEDIVLITSGDRPQGGLDSQYVENTIKDVILTY